MFETMRPFVMQAWRNLPPIGTHTPMFMISLMMASEGYDVNHNTIRWEGATPNTFAYVWTVIERMRQLFVETGNELLIQGRDSVGYCAAMNMREPPDAYIYVQMSGVPPQAAAAIRVVSETRGQSMNRDFVSFCDFVMAMRAFRTQ